MLGPKFLKLLLEATPPVSELEAYGLDQEEIEGIQACFHASLRSSPPDAKVAGGELERMITLYDCSTVEVGLIRFLSQPLPHLRGIQVAWCEADAVVVSDTGSILTCYHDDPQTVLESAVDSESFLDALSSFVTSVREKSLWKDNAELARRACVERCSVQAGARDSAQFFRLLCG